MRPVASATEIRASFSKGGSENASSICGRSFLTRSKLVTLSSPHSLTPNRTKRHLWAGIHRHPVQRWDSLDPRVTQNGAEPWAPSLGSCDWSCLSQGSPGFPRVPYRMWRDI